MTHPVIAARRRRQRDLVEHVERWARDLVGREGDVVAVVVFGSVARGDFNKWSDTDVLVIARALPDEYLARAELLAPLPPGVQAVAWTVEELTTQRRRRDAIAVEVDSGGICVWGSVPAPDPAPA